MIYGEIYDFLKTKQVAKLHRNTALTKKNLPSASILLYPPPIFSPQTLANTKDFLQILLVPNIRGKICIFFIILVVPYAYFEA